MLLILYLLHNIFNTDYYNFIKKHLNFKYIFFYLILNFIIKRKKKKTFFFFFFLIIND